MKDKLMKLRNKLPLRKSAFEIMIPQVKKEVGCHDQAGRR
jgi:hypothetical protein